MSDTEPIVGTESSWRGYALGEGSPDPRRTAFDQEVVRLADPPALAAVGYLVEQMDLLEVERRWTQRAEPGDELAQQRATAVGRARVDEARVAARAAAAARVGEPAADRIGALIEDTVRDLEQNPPTDPIRTYFALHARVLDEAYRAGDAAAQQIHDQLAVMATDTARGLLDDLERAVPGSLEAWQHEQTLAAHLRTHPYLVPPTRSTPDTATPNTAAAVTARNALRPRVDDRRGATRPALRVLPGGAQVSTGTGRGAARTTAPAGAHPVAGPTPQPEGRRR